MLVRFSAPILLAASLLASGCKKTDKAPPTAPAGSAATGASGSAGSVATPPKEAPVAQTPPATQEAQVPAPPPGSGPDGVVKAATLEAIQLPKPKKLPAKGNWSAAIAARDGDRLINYVDGDMLWISVHFVDCNLPAAKEAASKPANQRGVFAFCHENPVGKIKDYPLYGTSDMARGVKAGHLLLLAGIGASADPSYTTADLEEFLGSLDLAALAKL
jgi:hypothetical protein